VLKLKNKWPQNVWIGEIVLSDRDLRCFDTADVCAVQWLNAYRQRSDCVHKERSSNDVRLSVTQFPRGWAYWWGLCCCCCCHVALVACLSGLVVIAMVTACVASLRSSTNSHCSPLVSGYWCICIEIVWHVKGFNADLRVTSLRASAMLKHVIAIGLTSVRPSVCLSVCHMLAPYQNGWIYCHAFFTTW